MTCNYKLNIDASLPGVRTTVTQHVDFAALEDGQLRRCIRAVQRGHIACGGYVAGLVRAAAKHLGVSPPLTVQVAHGGLYGQASTVAPLPESRYGKAFADLIKLSEVRWALAKAQLATEARPYQSYVLERKSGWAYGDMLTLYGWAGQGEDFRKELTKTLRAAGYYDDLKTLAEFIASKPSFEV